MDVDVLSLLHKSGDEEDVPDDFDKEEVVLGVEDDRLTAHMRAQRERKSEFVPSAPLPTSIIKDLSAFAVDYEAVLRQLTDLDAELRALQRTVADAPAAPKAASLAKSSSEALKAARRHSARFNLLRRDVLAALQAPAASPAI